MLKFIQNNREITALLAVVLLFVLPGFLDRQYLIQDRSWKNVNLCICLKAFIVAAMHNTKTAMG